MEPKRYDPYVPASKSMPELTVKALVLGVLMAVVLGAANAVLGMRAGLTVAATFPAAVVAMAALRLPFLRGTILEENVARTAASVGEALVAGAIFTIPAFILSDAWDHIHYWPATLIMLIGGFLGVLYVIVLRRSLVVEADLPFPESVAASEIVKAGQGGQTGAKLLFGAMGFAGFWELLKNPYGIQVVRDSINGFFNLGRSTIQMFGRPEGYTGGILLETSSASPALMGVGFIVGLRVAAVLFAGAVLGWLLLVPLSLFLNPALAAGLTGDHTMTDLAYEVWSRQVRPLAVGTMIVAAFYTLWNLRSSLVGGIRQAFTGVAAGGGDLSQRTEKDLDFKKVFGVIALSAVPLFFVYQYFAQNIAGSLILTVVMIVLGFLFAAVAGYLVGLIGSSNNPISGLTLSALVISAVLMVAIGLTDVHGVAAVLAVAGVVCCAAGIAGDMMQDLKVGHILGGTPWRMEIAEIIGVLFAALVLAPVLSVLHQAYTIGSAELPAPQAGLMALLSKGIVGGEMAWPLVITGMFLALGLILMRAPSPMLIAVGMYLPFFSTAAIFVGGVIRWVLDLRLKRKSASPEEVQRAENTGVLLSSGFIAGETLMSVIFAFLVLGAGPPPQLLKIPVVSQIFEHVVIPVSSALLGGMESISPASPSFLIGLVIYPILFYLLAWLPVKKMKERGMPATKIE